MQNTTMMKMNTNATKHDWMCAQHSSQSNSKGNASPERRTPNPHGHERHLIFQHKVDSMFENSAAGSGPQSEMSQKGWQIQGGT
jgi:hypothetical protein